MAQQRRYWIGKGDRRSPRAIFCEQFLAQLCAWRSEGEKLLVLMDTNEDMQRGKLARKLTGEALKMVDVIQTRSGQLGPPTYVRGQRQIDGAWATPDLSIDAACFTLFFFGIGDHRGIVLDIPVASLIGETYNSIGSIFARRLQCNKSAVRGNYNRVLETYCYHHRLESKIEKIHRCAPYLSPSTFRASLNLVDKVLGEGMVSAEKKCRRI